MTNTTATTTDTDLATLVDLHLQAYAEPDAERRARLVAQAWDPAGTLLDPPFDGTGHEAIAALGQAVVTHYPGHTFRRTTAIDTHHGFARYGWELVGPDGTVAVGGVDVIELTAAGKLGRIVGFFGDLAPA